MRILAKHEQMFSQDLFSGTLVGSNTSQLWSLLEAVFSKGEAPPKEEKLTAEKIIKFYCSLVACCAHDFLTSLQF